MDPQNQANIKKIYDEEGSSGKNLVVVLGSSDIEGAEIYAETVTVGDPGFAGPLAGVSLRLPVYHILEPTIAKEVPKEIYDENVGIWTMTEDVEAIGQKFDEMRSRLLKG